jgi:hypothetical protein
LIHDLIDKIGSETTYRLIVCWVSTPHLGQIPPGRLVTDCDGQHRGDWRICQRICQQSNG